VLRIIYYSLDTGYKMQNRDNHKEILELEETLKSQGLEVVCIIDLMTNYIFNKSSDFIEHIDKVEGRFFDWDYVR
jgi:hypothetical protein